MRVKFMLAGLVLLGQGAAQAQDPRALTPEQLFEQVAPSVWRVQTFDAQHQPLAGGSAVVIAPGSLVTNCHVLAKASRVAVTRDNVSYGATLEHPDPERDLCLLKVANFTAPAVPVAGVEALKVGSRVYAIGNPRGFEQTISDGLLSGLRRSASGDFTALQVTVPISAGSSGGGLFDARGRLIGITTFTLRDAQNVNFALPADWIAEVPQRARAALTARSESRAPAGFASARLFEYQLRDRLTGVVKPVVYRLDRTDGDKLVFNQGSRVEKRGGEVLSLSTAVGGEFDQAMPPGGWISSEPQPGAVWSTKYQTQTDGRLVAMRLRARTLEESTLRLKDRELRIVRVQFDGHTIRGAAAVTAPGSYTANAWYAPELGRVVRFDARGRGGSGAAAFVIDEVLELVDIRAD